jgi:hypothetical protein
VTKPRNIAIVALSYDEDGEVGIDAQIRWRIAESNHTQSWILFDHFLHQYTLFHSVRVVKLRKIAIVALLYDEVDEIGIDAHFRPGIAESNHTVS